MKTRWICALVAIGIVVLVAPVAQAGSIFEIIGNSPLTLPHPSGIGTQAASGTWGHQGTGSGFLDGKIEFSDSFVLPATLGTSMAFDETDLKSFTFKHLVPAVSGGGSILPLLSFTATNPGGISSASGSVVHGGTAADPEFWLFQPVLETSVVQTVGVVQGGGSGAWTGNWGLDGTTVGLMNAIRTSFDTPTDIYLIVDGQYDGLWRMTGTAGSPPGSPTAVPLPATGMIAGFGLLGLALLRRSRRRR